MCLVLKQILTSINMTGTSISTPTTVAKAAPDESPNSIVAVAMATSKWLLAPIIAEGAASSYLNFSFLANQYVRVKIKIVCRKSGMAIQKIVKGCDIMISPLKENKRTRVKSKAIIDTGDNKRKNLSLNQSIPL
jgi:hypothetical protein